MLTSYNFLRVNILEGLSEYFGSDPKHKYILGFAPEIFTLMYPVVLASCIHTHIIKKRNKNESGSRHCRKNEVSKGGFETIVKAFDREILS